jgi:segregation and condensation protein A
VSSTPLNIQLEHYEGPLDLLLDLIRKQEINIYDIPIARITQQYLDYVHRAMELDIELSADFVYMAATLIHIKSRLLLPRDPELDRIDPQDDPRQELVDRLLEHERFRSAAQMLEQKRMVEEAIWSNPPAQEFLNQEESPELQVTLFDLVKTLETVLERFKNRPLYEVTKEDVSVPDMVLYLKNRMRELPKNETVAVFELFDRQRTRRAMICLFLAILEMVKQQAIMLTQKDSFGEIHIKKDVAFDSLLSSGEEVAKIEEEYSK